MYYYPVQFVRYYPYQPPLPYYPYPDPVSFDPYKIKLPKISHPANRCQQECLSMGYRPGTLEWQFCMRGCSGLLGSMLDDPQFVEDMMEE